MKFATRAKLYAVLSGALAALMFWRRPARTTEITLRRRPADDEQDD